jgi:amino acid transporter
VDPFSYIIVFTSIILGLGVTRTVGGLGHLLQTRKRRCNYWVHALWMLNLLLLMALIWFVAYRWRENQHWPFLLFVWLMLAPIIFYLIASLLFPDQDDAEPITDWQIYFFDHNREIFLLFALVFPIDLIDTALKGFEHFRAQGPFYATTMIMCSFFASLPRSPNGGASTLGLP